jgi:hypothetical protein
MPVKKGKSKRIARILAKREPQLAEPPRGLLALRGSNTSETGTAALRDLVALKKPHAKVLSRKNLVRPFEDATSIEFLAEKNDCAAFVYASNSKKRPDNLVLVSRLAAACRAWCSACVKVMQVMRGWRRRVVRVLSCASGSVRWAHGRGACGAQPEPAQAAPRTTRTGGWARLPTTAASSPVTLKPAYPHMSRAPFGVQGRTYDAHVLDMFEFGITGFDSLADIKGPKKTIGSSPCMVFNGEEFERTLEHKKLKNLLLGAWVPPQPLCDVLPASSIGCRPSPRALNCQ